MLLIGAPERVNLESAQAALEAGFDRLEQLTHEEIAFVPTQEEQEREQHELDRLRRMRALYTTIDRSAERLFALRRRASGRGDRALSRRLAHFSDIKARPQSEYDITSRRLCVTNDSQIDDSKLSSRPLHQLAPISSAESEEIFSIPCAALKIDMPWPRCCACGSRA